MPDDCSDFELVEEYDDIDDEEDEEFSQTADCPECDGTAYWNGSEYECENCGCCFLLEE